MTTDMIILLLLCIGRTLSCQLYEFNNAHGSNACLIKKNDKPLFIQAGAEIAFKGCIDPTKLMVN